MWFTKSRRAQSAEDFETWVEGGVTPTLNSFDNGDIRSVVLIVTPDPSEVCKDDVVRRLTPLEYERLQGFPDNWTDTGSDAQRYKQMGNAVTVNVIKWIGKNL